MAMDQRPGLVELPVGVLAACHGRAGQLPIGGRRSMEALRLCVRPCSRRCARRKRGPVRFWGNTGNLDLPVPVLGARSLAQPGWNRQQAPTSHLAARYDRCVHPRGVGRQRHAGWWRDRTGDRCKAGSAGRCERDDDRAGIGLVDPHFSEAVHRHCRVEGAMSTRCDQARSMDLCCNRCGPRFR